MFVGLIFEPPWLCERLQPPEQFYVQGDDGLRIDQRDHMRSPVPEQVRLTDDVQRRPELPVGFVEHCMRACVQQFIVASGVHRTERPVQLG